MKMSNMNKESRPRERLINNGSKSLSDIELLAIMLGSGSKEESVIDLSARIISEYSFKRLFKMSFNELKKIKGIKEAKATKLMACFEIARRCMIQNNVGIQLLNSKDVYEYVLSEYSFIEYEMVTVIYTDIKCRVIDKKIYSNDLIDKASFPIRKIINECLNNNSYGIFIIHNHPSGDIYPSKADIETTLKIIEILNSINVVLFDHLIINKNNFFSFEENKLLNNDLKNIF